MSHTPLHDELEATLARLPDDATITLPARDARALVHEAAVITEWMDTVTR